MEMGEEIIAGDPWIIFAEWGGGWSFGEGGLGVGGLEEMGALGVRVSERVVWGAGVLEKMGALGVRVSENMVWGVGVLEKMGVLGLLGKLGRWIPRGKEFELPDYEAFREELPAVYTLECSVEREEDEENEEV
jgi:hypothetical protein